MSKHAQFRVDPRLASLLGETYRSTEHAIKELIDNAWDADAENVWITLPEPMTHDPIVVRDDGTGMTESEVLGEYLSIARDRRTRKGERSAKKGRLVKGRKGIGKFAGLVAAELMDIRTEARGGVTTLRISKKAILEATRDLERIDLPLTSGKCEAFRHGTTLTLAGLSPNLSFPKPARLRELLALDYGRESDFTLTVNGEVLAHEDIPGEKHSVTVELPNAGKVTINFTIMERPASKSQAGLVMRVGGKIVGRPSLMGLNDGGLLPDRLLNRIVGEVIADGLEADVTADWGAIIENSTKFDEAREWIRTTVTDKVAKRLEADVAEQVNRRECTIEQRLSRMPTHRREIAREQLRQVLKRFYGETEERVDIVVALMLDAMEKDEYWLVCDHIHSARFGDVELLASALEQFGLVDLAVIVQQARRRLEFLDYLDVLNQNSKTLEKEMHTALDRNLWVFGPQFSMMATNKTLATTIETYANKHFKGERKNKRPDLFLAQDAGKRHLLIEFKRPRDTVGRDAEAQTKKYRDDLTPNFGHITVLIVGGEVDASMSAHYEERDVTFLSYTSPIVFGT